MPIENERKFVLNELATELEANLTGMPGVARHLLRQAYLDAPGLRIRSLEGDGETTHVFTYKRTVDGQVVEIETGLSAVDFGRLWTQRKETLVKVRYSWTEGRYHWDVDFFRRDDGSTYFAMAEVEMPEDQIEPLIAVACPNILFPYAREAVSDAVSRAGFQPIVLQPVNFEGMYMQRLQQQEEQAAGAPADASIQ